VPAEVDTNPASQGEQANDLGSLKDWLVKIKILSRIKNPAKDFCWWDLDGVCRLLSVVVVVQW